MRLKHLSIRNFRGITSMDLDLDRPVTVLVGANGAGKTSVLHAIAAHQKWVLLVHNRRYDLPGVGVHERDARVGASDGEVIVRAKHRESSYGFRVWWDAENPPWQGLFHECNPYELWTQRGVPFLFLVGTERRVDNASVRPRSYLSPDYPDDPAEAAAAGRGWEDEGAVAPFAGYARFIEWFKEREDAENARRVAARNLDLQDPQLRSVREAVAALMPGFDALRIDREQRPPAMVVTKDGLPLRLDQLSDGERNLVALAGDLARRMVIADPSAEPSRESEGVILIDEVEQHLHPAWQRRVIPALQRAFPRAQFIVTTHSPQVLSSVDASSVVVLDGSHAGLVAAATRGRDTNAILREVFGVSERPEEEHLEVLAIAELIDADRLEEARAKLLQLATRLTEHDDAVLTLRNRLSFAEVGL